MREKRKTKTERKAIKRYDRECLAEVKLLLKQVFVEPLEILIIDSMIPGSNLPSISPDYLLFQARQRKITYSQKELNIAMESIILTLVAIREEQEEQGENTNVEGDLANLSIAS